jgi:hypothetical protein
MIAIDAALRDRNLLGAALGDPESWATWLAVLKAAFAEPLDEAERTVFDTVSGGREPPAERVSEFWCVAGRRSGKSRMAAAVAVYLSRFRKYTLAPGEIGTVAAIASSRSQAKTVLRYALAFLERSPVLRGDILNVTADTIELRGGIEVSVFAGSFRTSRGRTLVGVVGDETAFWRDETSATPDIEIFRACAPSLAASGGMWVGISTGYRRQGLLYTRHRDHYGKPSSDVLVIQADSRTLNPTLKAETVAKASAADPEAAVSEWEGGFRSDISAFLDDQTIDAAVDHARPLELPPRREIIYRASVDASGGRHDAFTIAIGHADGDSYVIDVVRGHRPPFDPQEVTREFTALAREYGCREVVGDNYAAAWVEQAFRRTGIGYRRSALPASGLYLEILPLWVRGCVAIPNHPALLRELRQLERRTRAGGKDSVTHPERGHDDHANVVASVLKELSAPPKRGVTQLVVTGAGCGEVRPQQTGERVRAWVRTRRVINAETGEPFETPPPIVSTRIN